MIYADYSFYTESFYGTAIEKSDFNRLALRASQFLDYYTQGKAKDNAALEAVKMACCAIAERVAIVESANVAAVKSVSGNGLKSESVGSYSVSYETASERISAAEGAKEGYAAIAREYLVNTGLLYRGGRCCGCTHPMW